MSTFAVRHTQMVLGTNAEGRLVAVPSASVVVRKDGSPVQVYSNRTKTPLGSPGSALPTGVPEGSAGIDSMGNMVVWLNADDGYDMVSTIGGVSTIVPLPTISPDAEELIGPTVIRIGPNGTWANIAQALADLHAAGGGVVELMGSSYSGSTELLFTEPTVSMRGQGSGATVLNYTGSGACIRWANNPFTVQQQGELRGLTIRGTSAAGARGIYFIDTGTLPALDDIVVENFTGAFAVGIRIENATLWNERANGNRVHLNYNTIGLQLVGGQTADANSFGYHRWIDLRLNLAAGQIGIQTTGNAFVYNGLWNVLCNIDGSNAVVFDIAGESSWLRDFMVCHGEQTQGTGGLGVRVGSTAYFNVLGVMILGVPNQNNNVGLTANGVVPASLRVSAPGPVVHDAGERVDFFGSNDARIVPWLNSGDGDDLVTVGRLIGTDIESMYVSVLDVTGNAFVIYKVGRGQPLQNAVEVARMAVNGDFTVSRGLRPGRFTTANRPAPNSVGEGTMIYNLTTLKPNWSDDVNWRDAAGNIV